MITAKRIYKMRNENDMTILCLEMPNHSESAKAIQLVEKMKKAELLDVEVKVHKEKRSNDANAYFWTLCDKIAKVLSKEGVNKTKIEVYRDYIKDYSTPIPLPVKSEAVEEFCRNWQTGGIGWLCEIVDDSKLQGYKLLHVYYGSSTFDKEQMSRLIDAVVNDAKELGIETRTPDQLAELKALWERK